MQGVYSNRLEEMLPKLKVFAGFTAPKSVHKYIECTYTRITLDCITLHCTTLHYNTMPVALGPTNLGLLNEQLHQALELVLVSCNIKSARGQLEFTSLSSLALWGAKCNLSVKKRNIRGQHNVRTLLLLVPK